MKSPIDPIRVMDESLSSCNEHDHPKSKSTFATSSKRVATTKPTQTPAIRQPDFKIQMISADKMPGRPKPQQEFGHPPSPSYQLLKSSNKLMPLPFNAASPHKQTLPCLHHQSNPQMMMKKLPSSDRNSVLEKFTASNRYGNGRQVTAEELSMAVNRRSQRFVHNHNIVSDESSQQHATPGNNSNHQQSQYGGLSRWGDNIQ